MPDNTSLEKIANILRTDKHRLGKTIDYLSAQTGKQNVLDKIVAENDELMQKRMLTLGVSKDATAKEVYDALISKIESDDHRIVVGLGNAKCSNKDDCQDIGTAALKVVSPPKGFFLKLEKAREFMIKEPPKKIMEALGYASAEEMLAKEDIMELYSALRFVEDMEWLNGVFFKQYEALTPADFEERDVQVKALSPKWDKAAQKFLEKKKHNISHLKELGVVFIIPALLGISGEVLRIFALIMHYLYEIPFYSTVFKQISGYGDKFAPSFISLLRGDVFEKDLGEIEKSRWLVVQRYLAKIDDNDWRLFVPHINPEAIHWMKAEENLFKVGLAHDGYHEELKFWQNLSWVGDYFKDDSGVSVLVSFNLVDTVMSLVKEKEMVKYLYHQQEALWNKIFMEFFGAEKLEEYAMKYLWEGYFEI